jgi:hypothetical protein
MSLTRFLSLAALATLLAAQDRRNTDIVNTDSKFKMPDYTDLKSWQVRARQLQRQILSAGGLYPLGQRVPPNVQIFGKVEKKDYTIEKVLLETMPGYFLGGNLYRPAAKGKFPAVLTPHGHWTYGRLENQPLNSTPTLAINLARHGFVVFAYDMVGYTDTIQTPHDFGGSIEQLWNFGPLQLQLLNSIRSVDWIQTLEDVDPSKISVTGASGGGTQAFLLAAADERIKASAPVNMVSFQMQGGSPCENAPGLRIGTNNVEFASVMAPRPMLMVSATGDWTKAMLEEEYPAVRKIYQLYDKPEMVEAARFDAPHNYNKDSREAVYRFLMKQFYPDQQPFREANAEPEKLQQMLALQNNTLPKDAKTYAQIFDGWKQQSRTAEASVTKERVEWVFGAEWPVSVTGDPVKGGALSRAGRSDKVPFNYRRGRGDTVLYVHGEGLAAAMKSEKYLALAKQARPILVIDAFQTGAAAGEKRDESHRHFLTFQHSDDAERVQDVLTALRWLTLQSKTPITVTLDAEGPAQYWVLSAAALAPAGVKIKLGFDAKLPGDDAVLAQTFFVPGLQWAGGVEALAKLATR